MRFLEDSKLTQPEIGVSTYTKITVHIATYSSHSVEQNRPLPKADEY